jgi:hypothetical protein
MIANPEGPSFITRTVGRRRYSDDASVSHDPEQKSTKCARRASLRGRDAIALAAWARTQLG